MPTNEIQITAVEHLYRMLWKKHDFLIPRSVYEEAKEMEKKQIDNALTDRYTMGNLTFEEYYNKIYKTI
jgi:hypothetical protein